jgi:hypothetical protein
MMATELLQLCHSVGVTLIAGPGGTLVWEADFDPPVGLLDALAANKVDVLRLLAALPPDVSLLDLPPELFDMWQERACIMHFDGRLAWEQAKTLALADVLGEALSVAAQFT